jgi:multiple sugar transport system permease protein
LNTRSRAAGLGFLAPAAIYTVFFFGYPLARNLDLSLRNYQITSVYSGVAPFIGLANYRKLFSDPVFHQAALNTVVFVGGSLVFQFLIGLALAVFFVRSFPLSGVLRSLLLVPWLLPLVVTGTVFRWMLDTSNGVLNQLLLGLHLVDDPIAWLNSTSTAMIGVLLCNIWVGIPFNLVILYGGLQAIPVGLYEAAALDGAGAWRRFRHVTLPLLRPVITVVLTLGLIYTLKVFDVIWVLTKGGPANATHTITTYGYQLSFGGQSQFGLGAAAGNVLIAVAVVFGIFYLRTARIGREAA